ncbi:MAG: PDZ domain-containing protein [Candidatus Omnitrophica bacterium]|nr:PDZ domain-containing protein [Candidatus Omnitrophota bacterium]
MKKEVFITICAALFLAMLIISIFNHPAVQTMSAEALHEIKTADVWKTTAFTPNGNNGQGMTMAPIPSYNVQPAAQAAFAGPAAFPYPNGVSGQYPQYQVQGIPAVQEPTQPAALNNGMIPILDTQDKPVLIKKFGTEVVEITGGKIKITGVMGASWAQKAGLQAGDILLDFNAKEIVDLKQFQDMVTKAPPEASYKVVYMRNGQKKKCLITLGEGEMDGFTPIVPLK